MPFANTTVRTLDLSEVTDESCREDLLQVMQWQESATEALEMGYLRAMVLSIYTAEEKPQDRSIIETYVFSFKIPEGDGAPSMQLEHSGGAASSTVYSIESVRNSAVSLVRTLIRVAETMRPLPDERILDVHLFYHAHTPEDWQPSSGAFTDSTEDAPKLFAGGAPFRLTLGQVASRHHSLSLKVAYRADMAALEEDGENGEENEAPENLEMEVALTSAEPIQRSTVSFNLPSDDTPRPEQGIGLPSDETPHPQLAIDFPSDETPLPPLEPQYEGIDPDVLSLARSLILKKNRWTVKAFLDAVEYKYYMTNEQTRRILKQLVSEGILISSFNSFALSDKGSHLAEQARSLAAAASIEAASIPANFWIHKAIVSLLTACSKTKTSIIVKSTELRAELGIDRFLCDSIIARLKAIDVITSGGQGRNEVVWKHNSQKTLNDSNEQLRQLDQARSSSMSQQRGRSSAGQPNSETLQHSEPILRAEKQSESPHAPPPAATIPRTSTAAKRVSRTALAAIFDEEEEDAPPPHSKRRVF